MIKQYVTLLNFIYYLLFIIILVSVISLKSWERTLQNYFVLIL